MRKNNMENFKKFVSGKGYYIALVLCAIAIGISGYLYYRTASKPQQDPGQDAAVIATNPQQEIPVMQQPTKPGETTMPWEAPVPTTKPEDSQDATKPQQSTKPGKTASPVKGETVVPYAMDCLSYNPTTRDWRVHNGVDIAAEAGTQVCAAAAGEVYSVYKDDKLGHTVVIHHEGGYVTTYQSLDENLLVKPGDKVTLGQAIGTVGASALLESAIGDHVHFSVTRNGKNVDPAEFLS